MILDTDGPRSCDYMSSSTKQHILCRWLMTCTVPSLLSDTHPWSADTVAITHQFEWRNEAMSVGWFFVSSGLNESMVSSRRVLYGRCATWEAWWYLAAAGGATPTASRRGWHVVRWRGQHIREVWRSAEETDASSTRNTDWSRCVFVRICHCKSSVITRLLVVSEAHWFSYWLLVPFWHWTGCIQVTRGWRHISDYVYNASCV